MRRLIQWLIGIIILIILAWLGIWLYAEMRLKQLVTAEINHINTTSTQHLTYSKLTTSSSPLVAGITLLNPHLDVILDATTPPLTANAARIGAYINIWNPLTLHIDMPLKIILGNPTEIGVLTFASANITETLTSSVLLGNTQNPVAAGDGRFTGIDLLASNGSLPVAHIDSLTTQEVVNAQADKTQTALALTDDIKNLRLSPLFTRMLSLPFNGTISHFSSFVTVSGPLNWEQIAKQSAKLQNDDQRKQFLLQKAHEWAQAGGHAQGNLTLWIGPTHLLSDFALGFDSQVQPEGKANITANHIGQFINALVAAYPNLQGWATEAENLFSPYLSTTAQDGQVLAIHLNYGQTGVFVNGRKTEDMPFLDWNNLLNDTSQPAFAPGDGSGAASQ